MIGSARERLRESWASFRAVFANRNLRNVQLAYAAAVTAAYAYTIALVVYAYDEGGAAHVGLIGVIRTIPPAIVSPFAALLADRFPRERVMLVSDLVRVVLLIGIAGVAFADASPWLVYAAVGVITLAGTPFHPAEAALLPSLARTPEELTAANVASTTVESISSFIGPALGGLLLAATQTGVVFAATAGAFLVSAFFVSRITPPQRAAPVVADEDDVGEGERHSIFGGFRAIGGDRHLRLITILYAAQTVVAGALGVLVVVTALDLLEIGESGVGALNSAIGIGGLLGAVAAFAMIGRQRLAGDFGIGILLWGIPLALIGVWPEPWLAFVLLGVIGIGNTLVDVAALTLLQRTVREELLARVFGVMEAILVATMGLGAILAPLLVALLGARWALIIMGGFLPVLAALLWRQLTAIDTGLRVPARELNLLRGLPMFAALPGPALEHLASRLTQVRVPAGEVVVTQGEPGDRFYIVGDGRVAVEIDGSPVATLGPGEFFGEIALLRDVPRTATVTAETEATLYALDRDEFIGTVTGHAPSAAAANAVIASRLGAPRTGFAAI